VSATARSHISRSKAGRSRLFGQVSSCPFILSSKALSALAGLRSREACPLQILVVSFRPRKRLAACPIGIKKSLDNRYTNMITFVMLARQISLLPPLPTALTPLLRYSYKLFVAPKKVNSFVIKQIQTLSAKHPGWGVQLCVGSALSAALHTEARRERHPSPYCLPFVFMVLRIAFSASPFLSQTSALPYVFSSAVLFVTRFRRIFEAWSLATRHSPLATSLGKQERPGGLLRGVYNHEPTN
jgi:hypothetical protein